jgi:hypothetical protein
MIPNRAQNFEFQHRQDVYPYIKLAELEKESKRVLLVPQPNQFQPLQFQPLKFQQLKFQPFQFQPLKFQFQPLQFQQFQFQPFQFQLLQFLQQQALQVSWQQVSEKMYLPLLAMVVVVDAREALE